MSAAAYKRTGLHKLECPDCAGYVYATVAALEAAGLPVCGRCGLAFEPREFELAYHLDMDAASSRAIREYEHECNSVMRGQIPHYRAGRRVDPPEVLAGERCVQRRRESAKSNRLRALLPVAEPLPF
jgi:transcription elongation factor Elf1